jgi:hypothetical protein
MRCSRARIQLSNVSRIKFLWQIRGILVPGGLSRGGAWRGDITHACIRMCVRARARDHGNRDAMRCPRARGAGGRMPISYLALYDRPVVWLPHSLEHHMGRSACHSPHRDHIRVAMGVTASHALEKRLEWLARLQGSYTIKKTKS